MIVQDDLQSLVATEAEVLAVQEDYAVMKSLFVANAMEMSGVRAKRSELEGFRVEQGWAIAGVSSSDVNLYAQREGLPGEEHLVWLHPEVLKLRPDCLDYYMSLASVGNKFAGKRFPNLKRIMSSGLQPSDIACLVALILQGTTSTLTAEIRELNRMITRVLAESPNTKVQRLFDVALANHGAAIDGRWKDEIGRIGTAKTAVQIARALGLEIQTIDYSTAGQRKTARFSPLTDSAQAAAALVAQLERQGGLVSGFELRNGFKVYFNREKVDVLVLDPGDEVVAGGEVKANTDPQNAWERWRIARESLEQIGNRWPRALRFYVGLCMNQAVVAGTSAGRDRIGIKQALEQQLLHEAFNLYHIEQGKGMAWSRFRGWIRSVCGV